jgi:superfamily II DNA or RNA helicase
MPLDQPQSMPDQKQQKKVSNYFQLSEQERGVLQIFAVLYESMAKTRFVDLFSPSPLLDDETGSRIQPDALKKLLARLTRAGFLVTNKRKQLQCSDDIVEVATRETIELGLFKHLVKTTLQAVPLPKEQFGYRRFDNSRQLMRQARIYLYSNDIKQLLKLIETNPKSITWRPNISLADVCDQVVNNPFDADWLITIPATFAIPCLDYILRETFSNLEPADAAFALLHRQWQSGIYRSGQAGWVLTEQLLLRGDLTEAEAVLDKLGKLPESEIEPAQVGALQGWLALTRGQTEIALAHYSAAYKQVRKTTAERQRFFSMPPGLFFIFTLLKSGTGKDLKAVVTHTNLMQKTPDWILQNAYGLLGQVAKMQQGQVPPGLSSLLSLSLQIDHPEAGLENDDTLLMFVKSLCTYWSDPTTARKVLPEGLLWACKQAQATGYHWLAAEWAELLKRCGGKDLPLDLPTWRSQSGAVSLVDAVPVQEPWEWSLNALAKLQDPTAAIAAPVSERRLAWFLSLSSRGDWQLQPKEQKITAKGDWSRGRAVAMKRLAERDDDSLDYLTAQDRRVCDRIDSYQDGYSYYRSVYYEFEENAIAALVGHPAVFWEDAPTTRVELVKGEPELLVQALSEQQLRLSLYPPIDPDRRVLLVKETPTRVKVIELSEGHQRIANILGSNNSLEVPSHAKERVLSAISAVAGIVTVHSDIGGESATAETVDANPQPHIHLLPAGEGLKVAALTRPFGDAGPYYPPGSGGTTVLAEIKGQRLQTHRDQLSEKRLVNAVIQACPTLNRYPETHFEWLIDQPEDCLELLSDLQVLGDTVQVEWPEGEKMRLSHRADTQSFSLNIQRQRDWFAASGSLQLDDNLVLDMQQLMQLLSQTPSRFVPLGDGQFLALTETFRKRLDELRSFSENHKDGVRFHPLAIPALEDLMDEVGQVNADKHWKDHLKRLKSMRQIQPQVPSTLQAELRDYQIDGFTWLARLAHWGVGACLADDMGLGKTLQALALVLTRAPEGPTLVIAPTSVAGNWLNEATKFAPTLNPLQFGSCDRQQLLDNLQPFDLLVCSYGLLQQEDVANMLAEVEWQTIILDEAQAIKNSATKRSQAAMKLQGGFKLLTTGTPIENHLGELWNLFRFINPGLLGSADQFQTTFAVPIERYQDKPTRQKLKKLIQPFILRRTKSQVLSELPSRTEITLQVELSREEKAFYEALRREALIKLTESNAEAGTKHLQVLAEIMRLRRACCNPELVTPGTGVGSSKLDTMGEVLSELLENRHKALIFSQFVDHLHLIREYLDDQKIAYQYLDGSTPAKQRQQRVAAFQGGEGDVFLISLKAGGTGLNLTAADYVIHMDPWWNPAVEDQASDRAHRIGQQRPVTIYRLVAQGTIEEQIVDLHQQKRDLADSLLDGTDVSGKVSTEDLLRLIQAE